MKSMSADTTQRVIKAIAKVRHVPPESISPDATFEELQIDSLDGIQILFELEGEFGIDIPDDQARLIRSVRQAAEGIEILLAAKQSSQSGAPS
ncbi:MAG TPA: phosphopantetheine-binding protein [Bryobacteraceae bacterium]|nr:phosphopantetheine-binding protein [Bryobacteraceae bacterium]